MPFRIEHYTEPDGVAIERDEGGKPTFVVPFPKDRFYHAEALDNDTVLFIGGTTEPSRQRNTLLLAAYNIRAGRFTRRAKVAGVTGQHHLLSRDRSRLFVGGGGGIAVIDLCTLTLLKRYDRYKLDGETGRAVDSADRPGGDEERRQAGWTCISVRLAYEFGETDAGHIVFVERIGVTPFTIVTSLEQKLLTIDMRSDKVQARVLVRTDGVGPLSRIDPQADLAFISSRQIAVFRAFAPSPDVVNVEGVWRPGEAASERAGNDEPLYGLPLHVWRLTEPDASPITVIVRSEPVSRWRIAASAADPWGRNKALKDTTLRTLDELASGADRARDVHWPLAARAFVYEIAEHPRDGTIWIAFADDCLRSLDASGRLGPLIRLAGEPGQMYGPGLTFENDGTLTVRRFPRSGPGLYRFDPTQFDGVAGPVSIEPLGSDMIPQRHAKAFAAFVRRQTRKRFTVSDWTRESCAGALEKQIKAIRNGFNDMVVASTARLNFTYRVGNSTLDEASFFAGLTEREVPVVPELRALLTTYLQALGEGGEGVQPWEDPDEGIGALGSAVRALAVLDPDALDIIRNYLAKRDGEHEGYCWNAVLPAYFGRHGWRDAATVRFGVFAVLNRFWGGAHPCDLDGLPAAMRDLTTPGDVAQTVRREADIFGQKPEWGHDAAAYVTAFCATLDRNVIFDRVVLAELQQRDTVQNS